jgi:hypothetical protein
MPLRTTLVFLSAPIWITSLLHAQAPDGDVQRILDRSSWDSNCATIVSSPRGEWG